jgi:hypothetical protein
VIGVVAAACIRGCNKDRCCNQRLLALARRRLATDIPRKEKSIDYVSARSQVTTPLEGATE